MAETIALDSFRPQSRRQEFELLRAQMENERSSFEGHWRDLGDFILPRRTRFFVQDSNRGDRRTKRIIDSTATLAVRNLAAGMMGGVTSPARPWFRLSTPDPDLAEIESVKLWLSTVTRRMTTVFLRSNLYQTLPITYKDMATFATSAIFFEEDFDEVFRTYPLAIGSYMLANDEKLRVRVFFREFRMTVRQLIEKFGDLDEAGQPKNFDNFSHNVESQWRNNHKETWIEVNHVVMPNKNFDPDKMESKFKKYISVYYERGTSYSGAASFINPDDDNFLSEKGYDVFPVLAPRWEVTGEDIYGTDCPGMTALGDIRQLQLVERRIMQALSKMVNPPMKGPSVLKTITASILPGAITYVDEREGSKGFSPVHEVDPRIAEIERKQDQTRERISRAFYEDLFLMLARTDRREITAREVEEKHEEKLLALGSVLERLNQDLLDPLIDLVFDMMNRQGMIPEPPEELQGVDLKVEYISIMAQAQKLAGLASVERLTAFVGQVATFDQTVLDKIDRDQLVDEYAEIVGVPPRIVVSDERVAEIRQERAQAEQAAQAAALAQQGAAAAKDLSKAKLDEDSMLSRLTEAAAAGQVVPTEEAV